MRLKFASFDFCEVIKFNTGSNFSILWIPAKLMMKLQFTEGVLKD